MNIRSWLLGPALDVLATFSQEFAAMSQSLDNLTAQVTANTTIIGSAMTLIQGIHQQLVDAGTDSAKLADLAAVLKNQDDLLAAAVAANTAPAPAAAVPAPNPPAPAPTAPAPASDAPPSDVPPTE